ncbi:DUF1972 domain-containing protein [Treponema sp. J25]|uniref:DUF1972 domain-containing protein n=1 Tax=Treponema sp. J25 TaxID=2094121 RepID=UPI00105162F7|nr:DUF1972 domain-containing protein [Treponema sp. J25]TCW60165.1 glycosyl transferase [Treponema sp. J25]
MILHILGTAGVPAQYGGFETLVDNILDYNRDYSITVFCSSLNSNKKVKNYKNARLKYIRLKANGVSSILYDFLSMLMSLNSDYMLVLGVSGAIFLPFIRLLYKGKIITNIDGLEWKRDKWNKIIKLYLKISERMAVLFSDIVVADNQGVVEYCYTEYKEYKDKIRLIEYGGDHVLNTSKVDFDKKNYEFVDSEYAITVCRIEPENNIHLILESISKIYHLKFVIIGNWNNSNYGKKLYDEYRNRDNIYLLNPIYEQTTLNSLRRNAKIYIHGHSAGGTNPSLVEAMNLGLPVFAFDCIYNRETTENKAKYWKNSEDLKELLINTNHNELELISKDMKLIADRRYKWEIISKKYFDLFN